MRNKKVAILLYGHMRTYQKCYSSLLDNLDCNEIDIYIHTWNKKQRTTLSFYDVKENSNLEMSKDEIIKCYKPKSLVVENELAIDEEKCSHTGFSLKGLYSMHYSLSRVTQQVINSGSSYDAYIITRPDVILKSKLNITSLIYYFSNYAKDIPNIFRASYYIPLESNNIDYFRYSGATDCLMVCNELAVRAVSKLHNDKDIRHRKVVKWAEDSFDIYLAKAGVLDKKLNYLAPYDWGLLRSSGEEIKNRVAILREIKLILQRLKKIIKLIRNGLRKSE
ncbi:hypothetical protein VCHA38P217_60039 [Vibrio chagasii]|nr:hypothetical protein VCHA38P217_60039 [Vibrio chagasii]